MRTVERVLLATLLAAASNNVSAAATRPDIVFMVADDLGCGRYTPRHGVTTVGSPKRGSAEYRPA